MRAVLSGSTKDRQGKCEERSGADPSARHVPSAKIENLGARAAVPAGGIKETDVAMKGDGEGQGGARETGGGDARERYEIRNWARESTARPTGCRCRPEDGPFALARGEKSVVLLCSPPGK